MSSLDAIARGHVTRRAGFAHTNRVMAKLYEDAVEGLGFSSTLFARDIINQATEKITSELAEEMQLFAIAMSDRSARNRDGRVTRIHQLAGERAVEATVRSYNRTRAKRRKTAASFEVGFIRDDGEVGVRKARESIGASVRRKDRFANGKLLRALASPQMFDARWDGVSFINKAWLDRNAAQWYRLAFGAGPRGAGTPLHKNHSIQFFGQTAFSMSLQGFGPSAGFSMPAGLWFGFGGSNLSPADNDGQSVNYARGGAPNPARRGLDQFIPGAGSFAGRSFRGRRTKGIKGTAYLDAGVFALTRELGRGWSVIMTEWFEEAATQDTGPIATIGVSPEAAATSSAKLKSELASMKIVAARYRSSLAL